MSTEKLDTSISNKKESEVLLEKMKQKEALMKKAVIKKTCKAVVEKISNGYKITYIQVKPKKKK